jgi:MFS family permease
VIETAQRLSHARIVRARVATLVSFGTLGGMMYAWSTCVTAFREQMELHGDAGDLRFGMIVLSTGIAAAIGSLAVGRFADRFGPRAAITACVILYPLALISLGYVHTPLFAVLLVSVLGLFRGALDTVLNAHGIQVERYYGRSIMSSFHACYSIGGFLIGLVGSWLSSLYSTSATLQFTVLGGTMMLLGLIAAASMLRKSELLPASTPESGESASDSGDTSLGTPRRSSLALTLLMIAFGVLLLGSMAGENVVGDWGQEYLHRVDGATIALAGLAIAIFTGMEAAGRVFGDRLAQHFGRPRVLFVSGLLSFIGLAAAYIANQPWVSLAGFAALGLGLSSIAPLMLSTAGRADPAHAGRNIGIVNSIGYSANLVSPATITFVVTHFGLQRLLLFPLLLLMPLAFLGPVLMRRAESYTSIKVGPGKLTPAHVS